MTVREILEELKKGNFKVAYKNRNIINSKIMFILQQTDEYNKKYSIDTICDLIAIGNITYNYSNADILPIEDGVYDKLVVLLQRLDYNRFQSGFAPVDIQIDTVNVPVIDRKVQENIKPFIIMQGSDMEFYKDKSVFREIVDYSKPFDIRANKIKPFYYDSKEDSYITKRTRTVEHNYPDLVGTLEKCKFVLDKQAIDLGVYNDSNVSILERDFFAPLLEKGIINYEMPIHMICTLKYDGVSIEADVTDEIISARTRGDTGLNQASDLTPIFEGYKFPNAVKCEPFGMKFEAIIFKEDLQKLNYIMGTNYINGRTAIIGLLGSSQARKYRDFITLVPLQADFGPNVVKPDRLTEIQFLNKYYANREYLRWTDFTTTYVQLMFYIKKYVEEAEFYRTWLNFMYDGVVVEFGNENLRRALGRKNSINQYARAIKFNPMSKITTFKGYTYTIGQNGVVVPMLHYEPVEFIGSIHTKCSGASYERFKELNLYVGDQIRITYVNDVIPYPESIPDLEYNIQNHMREPLPEEKFPTTCPCCGTKLVESAQGKSMLCPNMKCPERTTQRMTNMLAKLNIKDFSDAAVDTLNITSFKQLMNMTTDDFNVLGPNNKYKLYNNLRDGIFNKSIPDYMLIGALGFTNIASKKWKLIFSIYSLKKIFAKYQEEKVSDEGFMPLRDMIANIKGVGPATADTIVTEMEFFEEDIQYILDHIPYIETSMGSNEAKYQIRVTGFRDPTLVAVLNGFADVDCDDSAGVTKNTTILLVPYTGFQSGKVSKATKYGIPIVPIKDFLETPDKWIPTIVELSAI